MNMPNKVTATAARYIKLGEGGSREAVCLARGLLSLGYRDIPHEVAMTGDIERLRAYNRDVLGHLPQTSADRARQVADFYTLGPSTLWITFANGALWWAFAAPGVTLSGPEEADELGFRTRKTLSGWRNTSIAGKPLLMAGLNGNLTKKAMYRQTICEVYPDQLDYLLRKLNDEELPAVAAAQEARGHMVEAITGLMKLLQPDDFEILVDLVFSQSGWRRIGAVGKTQKTVDMELELPSTGERAFIQVKSHTKQYELDTYIEKFSARGDTRMFYVYHSARYGVATEHPQVTLIGPQRLAEMVLNAGLFDWLLQKAG